jgi:hypothetical protein
VIAGLDNVIANGRQNVIGQVIVSFVLSRNSLHDKKKISVFVATKHVSQTDIKQIQQYCSFRCCKLSLFRECILLINYYKQIQLIFMIK